MQTIHVGNMKKSAFIRSQLEAFKIGQKVRKNLLKKPFSTSIFEVLSNLYRLSLSCKRCALKGGGGKGKRREVKTKKEEKMGIKIVFYKSMCSGHFLKYISKTVIRLRRS